MLGRHPVDVMLLATDLGVARRFYGDTLSLEVLVADEQFLTFGCGGDSRLVVTKSTTGTAEAVTKASWRVDDIAGEVAELRARASRSKTCRSWGRSTASPTSGLHWRPGSPTRTTTGSACPAQRSRCTARRRRNRRRAGPGRPRTKDGGELAHGPCRSGRPASSERHRPARGDSAESGRSISVGRQPGGAGTRTTPGAPSCPNTNQKARRRWSPAQSRSGR
jgi:hypothetical protein